MDLTCDESMPTDRDLDPTQQRQQLLEQTTALLAAHPALQLPTISQFVQPTPIPAHEIQPAATPVRAPSVVPIQKPVPVTEVPPVVVEPIPQSRPSTSQVEPPTVVTAEPVEPIPEPIPEPEPPKKPRSPKKQDDYCIPMELKKYFCGLDTEFSNEFEDWPEGEPKFCRKKRIFLFNLPKNLEKFCEGESGIIHLLRKGYRFRTRSIQPIKRELKLTVQKLVENHREITFVEFINSKKYYCLEILLRVQQEQDMLKLEKDRRMTETLEKLDRGTSAASTQEYIERDASEGSGGTLESDSLVLAAVVDAVCTPKKQKNVQQDLCEPSTSYATQQTVGKVGIQNNNGEKAKGDLMTLLSESGKIPVIEISDESIDKEKGTNIDEAAGEKEDNRVYVDPEDIALLTNFRDNCNVFDDEEIERRKSQVQKGLQELRKLIRVSKRTENDTNEEVRRFLPEVVSLSRMGEDSQSQFVYEIPEEVQIDKWSWSFDINDRQIGVLPDDQVTVIGNLPLPFRVESQKKQFSDLEYFIEVHDQFMQYLLIELIEETKEYTEELKKGHYLKHRPKFTRLQPLSIQENSRNVELTVTKVLKLVQKQLGQQTHMPYDVYEWIQRDLIGTKKLLQQESNPLVFATAIQSYYTLVSFYRFFPTVFKNYKPILRKYEGKKYGNDFIEDMRKWSSVKEQILILAKKYDEQTKGQCSFQTCIEKAMGKLMKNGFEVTQDNETSTRTLEDEEIEYIIDEFEQIRIPVTSEHVPSMEEEPITDIRQLRMKAFEEREKLIQEYSERESFYNVSDYLGGSRFKSRMVNDFRFNIDHDGSIIGAGKSHRISNYPGQKVVLSQKTGQIQFLDPAKTITCDDPYFLSGNENVDYDPLKTGTSEWKAYKKWDKINDYLYKAFEDDANQLRSIIQLWTNNNEIYRAEYNENIQKLNKKCVSSEETAEAEKLLIAMLLIFKASHCLLDDEDEDEEEEEEEDEEEGSDYLDTSQEKKMLETVYDKTQEWFDSLICAEDADKANIFPELYGMAQFRNFYRTPALDRIIESGSLALRLRISDDDEDYFYNYDNKKGGYDSEEDDDDEVENEDVVDGVDENLNTNEEPRKENEEVPKDDNGNDVEEISESVKDILDEMFQEGNVNENRKIEDDIEKLTELKDDGVNGEVGESDDDDDEDAYLDLDDPFGSPGSSAKKYRRLKCTERKRTRKEALMHNKTTKMAKGVENSKLKKVRAAELIKCYINATKTFRESLPNQIKHMFDHPKNTLSTEAVLVNRGFVPPRFRDGHSSPTIENFNVIPEEPQSDELKKKGMQIIQHIEKDFGLKDVFDKESQKECHWSHLTSNDDGIPAVIVDELHRDPQLEPVEEAELLEHSGKLFEAELADVLYKSCLESNRSAQLIEQFERIHQRIQSHFRRKDCRDKIVNDFLKQENTRTELNEVESEEEPIDFFDEDDREIRFNVGISKSMHRERSMAFAVWSRRERRTVKAVRKLRKIISRISTVSSIKKAKTPLDEKLRRRLFRRKKSVFASIRALERKRLQQRAKILNAPKLMSFDKEIGQKVKNLIRIRQVQIRLAKHLKRLKKRKLPPVLTDEETSDEDYVFDDEGVKCSTIQNVVYMNEPRSPVGRQKTPELVEEYDRRARQGSPHPVDTLKAILETGMNKKYKKCSAKNQQEKRVRLLKRNMAEKDSQSMPSLGDQEMPVGMSAALMQPLDTMIQNTAAKIYSIDFNQEEIEKEIENQKAVILNKPVPKESNAAVFKTIEPMFNIQKITPIKNGKPLEPSPGYKAVLEKSARRKAKMLAHKMSRGTQTGEKLVTVEPLMPSLKLPPRNEAEIQEKAMKKADKTKEKQLLRRVRVEKDAKRKNLSKINHQICRQKIMKNLLRHRHLHSIANSSFKDKERDICTPPSPVQLPSTSAIVLDQVSVNTTEKWLGPLNYGDVLSRATSIEPDEIIPRIEKIMSSCPYKVRELRKQKNLEDLPLYDYVQRPPEPVKVKKKPGRKPKVANNRIENGTVNGVDNAAHENDISVVQKPRRGRPRKNAPNAALSKNATTNKDGKMEDLPATRGRAGRKKSIPLASGLEAEFDTNEDSASPELGVFASHDSRRENAPSPEVGEGSEEPSMTVEQEGQVRNAVKYHMLGVESEAETEESDDEHADDEIKAELDTSHESENTKSKKKRVRHRYDKRVNWSRKKKNKPVVPVVPVAPEGTEEPELKDPSVSVEPGASEAPSDKPKRKQRMRHKWADTPSRTPSPRPPSPPLPPKRTRKQAKPIEIVYDSPRKRKKNLEQAAETTENPPVPEVVPKTEVVVEEENPEKSDDEADNVLSNGEDKSATDDSSFIPGGSKKVSAKKKTGRQARKSVPKQPTKTSTRVSTKRKTSYSPEPPVPKKCKSVSRK
uniref:Uncharacterized protein n=3 Tax=Panagrolaimus sp. JU765 TaxID=591449 RepID=A0AC34RIK7_9BILA